MKTFVLPGCPSPVIKKVSVLALIIFHLELLRDLKA